MRYAARKDANHTKIVQALRDGGAYVYDIELPVDILCGYAGVTALVEIKTETGKHTKLQKDFMRDWKGGIVATIRDVEGAKHLLGVMKNGV